MRQALNPYFERRSCNPGQARSFHTIRTLRNSRTHGTPPEDQRYRRLLDAPERLREALKRAIDCLLP